MLVGFRMFAKILVIGVIDEAPDTRDALQARHVHSDLSPGAV